MAHEEDERVFSPRDDVRKRVSSCSNSSKICRLQALHSESWLSSKMSSTAFLASDTVVPSRSLRGSRIAAGTPPGVSRKDLLLMRRGSKMVVDVHEEEHTEQLVDICRSCCVLGAWDFRANHQAEVACADNEDPQFALSASARSRMLSHDGFRHSVTFSDDFPEIYHCDTEPPPTAQSIFGPVADSDDWHEQPLDRLAELIFVVGDSPEDMSDFSAHEPTLLARFPTDDPLVESFESMARDHLVACCFPSGSRIAGVGVQDSTGDLLPSSVQTMEPFVFTLLSSSLDVNEAPDPTNLLYCTVVHSSIASEEPHNSGEALAEEKIFAHCIVSRHPFIESFGSLLVSLLSGQEDSDVLVALGFSPRWLDEEQSDLQRFQIRSADGNGAFDVLQSNPGNPGIKAQRLRRTVAALRSRRAEPQLAESQVAPTRSSSEPPKQSERSRTSRPRKTTGPAEVQSAAVRARNLEHLGAGRPPQLFAYAGQRHPESTSACTWARHRSQALIEWAAVPLLEHLGADRVVQVVSALLLELSVVIVTRSVALGSAIVLGLSALLWPFAWQHPMIPVCPSRVHNDILDAPFPMLCAIARPYEWVVERARTPSTGDREAIICDLERGEVDLPADVAHLLRASARPNMFRRRTRDLLSDASWREHGVVPAEPSPSIPADRMPPEPPAEPPPTPVFRSVWTSKAAAQFCDELQEGVLEFSQAMLDASRGHGASDLGEPSWQRRMEERMQAVAQCKEEHAFFCRFIESQICLMFLDGAAAEE